MGAFAMTEPEAGSDVAAMTTVATRDGDHYVLNGGVGNLRNIVGGEFRYLSCQLEVSVLQKGPYRTCIRHLSFR